MEVSIASTPKVLKFTSPKEETTTPRLMHPTAAMSLAEGFSSPNIKPDSMVLTGVKAFSICTNATAVSGRQTDRDTHPYDSLRDISPCMPGACMHSSNRAPQTSCAQPLQMLACSCQQTVPPSATGSSCTPPSPAARQHLTCVPICCLCTRRMHVVVNASPVLTHCLVPSCCCCSNT